LTKIGADSEETKNIHDNRSPGALYRSWRPELAGFLSENGDIGPFRSILASLTAPLRRSIFREEFAQISWAELTKAFGVKDIGML